MNVDVLSCLNEEHMGNKLLLVCVEHNKWVIIIMLFFLGWYRKFPNSHTFRPSEILETMVAEGKLGVKSGEGFYKYDKSSKL